MSNPAKIEGTAEAWESGLLGADEGHVRVAPDQEQEIDSALELHPISIRLQKSLLENLKALAQLNGIGYQPLVRQILTRFVDSEMKRLLVAKLAEENAKPIHEMVKEAMRQRPPAPRAKGSDKTEKKAA